MKIFLLFTAVIILLTGCSSHYYHQSFDKGFGMWGNEMGSSRHFKSGGHRNGFVRFSAPGAANDGAHEPNMGIIHIVAGAHTGYPFGVMGIIPDLRDAEVSVYLRGIDFKPNGAKLVWLVQSQEKLFYGFKANWAYTDFPLTDYLLDGKWHKTNFKLVNDESKWTYAGDNPDHYGIDQEAHTYGYLPLNDVLAENNMAFTFILMNVNKDNPPTGSIDFDEFKISFSSQKGSDVMFIISDSVQPGADWAISFLEQSIESGYKWPGIYANLAYVYYKQDYLDKAFTALSKAISLNPDYRQYYELLQQIYIKKKDWAAAAAAYKLALAASSDHEFDFENCGSAYWTIENSK